jgi:hypothetical protein
VLKLGPFKNEGIHEPTMSIVAKYDEPILLVGTPMLMNGVTLCAIGVLIVSFGKVINLLLDVVSKPVKYCQYN